MNQEFIEALKKWAFLGRRCVDIQFNNQISDEEIKVNCYDYDLETGKIVRSIEEIPTTKQLKESKRESMQAILDRL